MVAALCDAGAALVVSKRKYGSPPPLVQTSVWGYVRPRIVEHSDAAPRDWALRQGKSLLGLAGAVRPAAGDEADPVSPTTF